MGFAGYTKYSMDKYTRYNRSEKGRARWRRYYHKQNWMAREPHRMRYNALRRQRTLEEANAPL